MSRKQGDQNSTGKHATLKLALTKVIAFVLVFVFMFAQPAADLLKVHAAEEMQSVETVAEVAEAEAETVAEEPATEEAVQNPIGGSESEAPSENAVIEPDTQAQTPASNEQATATESSEESSAQPETEAAQSARALSEKIELIQEDGSKIPVIIDVKNLAAEEEVTFKVKEEKTSYEAAILTEIQRLSGEAADKLTFEPILSLDISMGKEKLSGKVKVTITSKLLKDLKKDKTQLFHINKDGKAENLKYEFKEDKLKEEYKIEFETDEFSPFILGVKKAKDESSEAEEKQFIVLDPDENATEDLASDNEEAVDVSEHPLEKVYADEDEPLLAEEELSARTRLLLQYKAPVLKAEALEDEVDPYSKDGMKIEKLTVRWLTSSTGETDAANFNVLKLKSDSEMLASQQFQIDFALSGKDDHAPGSIEIVFPASIWLNRYGNEAGYLTLSVPEEPETGADFAWKRVDDKIIITNTRKLSAASKVMIQGTFRGFKAPDIVDIDVTEKSDYADAHNKGISDDFYAILNLTTPKDNVITMESNDIHAEVDTHIEAASANKSGQNTSTREYFVYHTPEKATTAGLPAELLDRLGEDKNKYSFVKWYVSGSATGSQPFDMKVTEKFDGTVTKYVDALHEQVETSTARGQILGMSYTDASNHLVVCPADDGGQTMTATLFSGYSTKTKSAYVWVAYLKEDFPEEGTEYTLQNSQTITVTGWDDKISTTKEKSAKVPFRLPIEYTLNKTWDYTSPKGVEAEDWQKPSYQYFRISYSDASGWHYQVVKLEADEEGNFTYTWDDEGQDRAYYVSELSSDWYRNTMGIGSTEYRTTYNQKKDEDGDVCAYDEYWYTLRKEEYDSDDHTWEYMNQFNWQHIDLAIVKFKVQQAYAWINKKVTNEYKDGNSGYMATSDRNLNLLRRGTDVIIDYTVKGGSNVMEYTGNGMDPNEIKNFGWKNVRVELEDNYGTDTTFENSKNNTLLFDKQIRLTKDDAEIAYVYLDRHDFKEFRQNNKYSPFYYYSISNGATGMERATDEILLAKQYDSEEWVEYATVAWPSGTISLTDAGRQAGARLEGRYVYFPRGIEKVKTSVLVPAKGTEDDRRIDGVDMSYRVGIRLLADSETLQKRLEAVFDLSDYGMCMLDNYDMIQTFPEGYDSPHLEQTNYARAYLHGRNHRVAVDAQKSFELVENDTVKRRLKLHTSVTMVQQSNVTSSTEYEQAKEEGIIPNSTEGVWYDLLPLSVEPDLDSVTLKGGDQILDKYTIPNYKHTGRILLVVKIAAADNSEYLYPTDPKVLDHSDYSDEFGSAYPYDVTYPKEGYHNDHTIEFDSYYSWDQVRLFGLDNVRNVAAYETLNESSLGNISGWEGEPDDPQQNNNQRAMNAVGADKLLMTNLDPDREDSKDQAFVYAGSKLKYERPDFMAETQLKKFVTRDGLGVWSSGQDNDVQVNVHEGDFYTYMLHVGSGTETTTKNIIFMDSLETYVPTEDDEEDRAGSWRGIFDSIDTSELLNNYPDVAPVFYYYVSNTPPDLAGDGSILNFTPDPDTKGYYTMEDPDAVYKILSGDPDHWKTSLEGVNKEQVQAIAVDLRHNKDGSDFELEKDKTLYITVRMRARFYETEGEDGDPYNKDKDLRDDPKQNDHAFNNVHLNCTQVDALGLPTHSYITYNYTRVGIVPFELNVSKVWKDENNNDGKRPSSVTVHLIGNGTDTGKSVTLDDSNEWKGSFAHIPQYDENGKWIEYSFKETTTDQNFSLDDYTMTYVRDNEDVTITNKLKPETTQLSFKKQWIGDEAEENYVFRPDRIVVRLMAQTSQGGSLVYTGKSIEVKADRDGMWKGSFTDLPKYSNPTGISGAQFLIQYAVQEEPVYKYLTDYEAETDEDGNLTGVTIIKNTFYPYGDLKVSKTVQDTTDASKDKEFNFNLILKNANGEEMTEKYEYTIYETVEVEADGESDSSENTTETKTVSTGQIGNGDSFKLKGGQYLVIKDIPSESTYEVSEEDKEGFTLAGSAGSSGSIRAGSEASASFTNQYSTEGSQKVSVKKTLSGREMERYQFSFEMEDISAESPRKGKVYTASANTDGVATFGLLKYNAADHGKTYTYEIREIDKKKAGYTYDTDKFTIEVTVTDNGDGTMTCTPKYFKEPSKEDEERTEVTAAEVCFQNEYHAKGEAKLISWKQLPGGTLTANQFHFELWGKTKNEQGEDLWTKLQEKGNDENGTIRWDAINFTEADVGKTYQYVVKEVQGNDSRVNYDLSVKGYELSIEDNGDGTLAITQKNVTAAEVKNESGDITGYSIGAETQNLPVFVNTLKPGALEITKKTTWDSLEPDGNLEFPFTLTLLGDEIADDAEITVQKIDGITNAKTYSSGKAPTPLTSEEKEAQPVQLENGSYSFTLKAGQKLIVKELPAGTTYQVNESIPGSWTLEASNAVGEIPSVDTASAVLTNKFEPGKATATIIGSKLMDNRPAAAGKFAFTLDAANPESNIENKYPKTIVNEAGGLIQKSETFNAAGTYVYTLKEIQGLVASVDEQKKITWVSDEDELRKVQFDQSEYRITIVVREIDNDGFKTLVADTPVITKDGVAVDKLQFNNSTRPGSLQITKVGEGVTEANKDTEFTFKVRLTNAAGMPLSNADGALWYTTPAEGAAQPESTPTYSKTPASNTSGENGTSENGAGENGGNEQGGQEETPSNNGTDENNSGDNGGGGSPNALYAPSFKTLNVLGHQASTKILRAEELIAVPTGAPTSTSTVGTNVSIDWYDSTKTIVIRPTNSSQTATVDGQTLKSELENYRIFAENILSIGTVSVTGSMWRMLSKDYSSSSSWQKVKKIDLNSLDVSAVTNFNGIFAYMRNVTEINVKDWNISNGSNLMGVFEGMTGLRRLDISGWSSNNASSNDMSGFYALVWNCSNLEYIDMRNLVIGPNANIYAVTNNCPNLSTIVVGTEFRFNTSGYKSSASSGFFNGNSTGRNAYWYRLGIDSPSDAISGSELSKKTGADAAGTWVRTGYNPNFTIHFDQNAKGDNIVTGEMADQSMTLGDESTLTLNKNAFESELNFAGWSTDPDAVLPEYADEAKYTGGAIGGQTITLYAIWMSKDSFLLHYNANGGYSRTQWQRVNGPSDNVTLPTATHPNNYEFLGWNTKEDGTGSWFKDTAVGSDFNATPGSTVQLYAQFLDPSKKAKLSVEHYQEKADGSGYPTTAIAREIDPYNIDAEVSLAENYGPHEYKGFRTPTVYTKSTVSGVVGNQSLSDNPTVTITQGGVTIKYYYERTRYKLKFEANGGEGTMPDLTVLGGVNQKLPVNLFTKENALFVGWNTAADGSGTNYGDGQSINTLLEDGGELTLYAQWFDLGGAGEVQPTNGEYTVKCKAGEMIVFPSLPAGTLYEISEVDLPEGWTLEGIVDEDEAREQSGKKEILSAERIQIKATNRYSASGSASIMAHKSLPGETISAGQFTFVLCDENGDTLQTVTNSMVDEAEQIPGDGDEMVANPWYGTAAVRFDEINYTSQGVYHYTIKEIKGEDSSIKYDTHEEHVTVLVTDRGDGRLNTQIFYDKEAALFVNEMESGNLEVSKILRNASAASKDQLFTFIVYLYDRNGVELRETYPLTMPDQSETMFKSGGEIQIKGGESFTVTGLPHNSSYLVTEAPAAGFEKVAEENTEGKILASETAHATIENAYSISKSEGGAGIVATKKYYGDELKDGQFFFRLSNEAGEVLEVVSAAADGSVSFSDLYYDQEDDGKRFIYYIDEVQPGEGTTLQDYGSNSGQNEEAQNDEDDSADQQGEDAGGDSNSEASNSTILQGDPTITYDTHREKVVVTARDNGAGVMETTITYEDPDKGAVFTNKKTAPMKIIKTLQRKEQVKGRLDPVTVVFQVDVNYKGELLSSNVYSMSFDSALDNQVIEIPDLPLGAEVTVKELYAGGNYSSVGAKEQTVTIVLDDPETEDVEMAEASFTNDYTDTWKGGGSVTNKITDGSSAEQSFVQETGSTAK